MWLTNKTQGKLKICSAENEGKVMHARHTLGVEYEIKCGENSENKWNTTHTMCATIKNGKCALRAHLGDNALLCHQGTQYVFVYKLSTRAFLPPPPGTCPLYSAGIFGSKTSISKMTCREMWLLLVSDNALNGSDHYQVHKSCLTETKQRRVARVRLEMAYVQF